jgi:membrane protein YqaA with SNARE-associated domain
MTETASLISLFFSSLIGATLLPGGSELVLFALLKNYPDALPLSLFIATLGNTLGGMISFYMGRALPSNQSLKYIDNVRRYGTPALLLAWLPLLGDALCLAAGWLRLNAGEALIFMAVGKFLRYAIVTIFV